LAGPNGPEGWNRIEDGPLFPLRGSRPFSLLGNLDNHFFYIGQSNATVNTFDAAKRLFLAINDDVPGNGSGAFTSQVHVWKKLPDVSADFLYQSVPTIIAVGQTTSVTVVIKNTGSTTWSAGAGYRLGSQNPQDNSTWGIGGVSLPFDVPPGSQVPITFNITAPSIPGNYNFQWRMVQDGVQWFGDLTDNFPITVVSGTCNQAEFVSQSVPSAMSTYETYYVSVTMRNTGCTIWQAGTMYRLGSQNPQDNTRWGSNRVVLPYAVPPGSQVTFNFAVTAPSRTGTYNFQWRMVQEGVEWFGNYTPNVAVQVRPSCLTC